MALPPSSGYNLESEGEEEEEGAPGTQPPGVQEQVHHHTLHNQAVVSSKYRVTQGTGHIQSCPNSQAL